MPTERRGLSRLAPGLLVAATGVGAGDLITASLAGSALGTSILWAVLVGALLKWVLNEGIARWQLATGTTLLSGWVHRLGRPMGVVFLAYLIVWSFAVGGALMTACGIGAQAMLPFSDPDVGKAVWGLGLGVIGLGVVRVGGLRVFERVMATCIVLMVVAVVATAVMLGVDGRELAAGLIPSLPAGTAALHAGAEVSRTEAIGWIAGVLGGVGGTVTLLSYGYWIRERGRVGVSGLSTCRVDLGVAYALTALFGAAMIVIGSRLPLEGRGASVAVQLADQLEAALGPTGRWIFLVGFLGAVFSSLLGVWQSVPYMAADLFALRAGQRLDPASATRAPPYVWWQIGLVVVPAPLVVGLSVPTVQLTYAVMGALFMPLLAMSLLVMNTRERWVGATFCNGRTVNLALLATLALFTWLAVSTFADRF